MSKKKNKAIITLLSGAVISGSINVPVYANAMSSDTASLAKSINLSSNKIGTITAKESDVRETASSKANIIATIEKDSIVEILDETNEWYKIKFIHNTVAYIKKTDVLVKNENAVSKTNQRAVTSSATKVISTAIVNTTTLNVRSGGSTSYSKIGSLTSGTKVNIVAKVDNNWYKIKYGNGYGYISGDYIKNITPVNSSSTTNTTTSTLTTVTYSGVTTAGLNVRSAGTTSASKIGYLNKGTKVQIVTKLSNGWYKIKYSTGYGYVSGSYVGNVTSVNTPSASKPTNTSSATTVKYTATVSADSLNVRKGGAVENDLLGKLLKGTKVEIVDKMSNGWSKIKYGSGYGYVNTSYLSNIKASSSSSNNTTATVIKTGTVNTDSLNVRKGSSTNYDVIGKLSRGTKVEIVKVESNGWYKIKYNSGYGYVSGKYVNIGQTNVTNERKNLNNFLFVGDSFTALLSNTIKANNSNVYVHAKSGSMPSYWLDKVSSMPSNSNVNGVVLLIGVNGAGYESNKTDVKTLINKLSARYPNKTIYVQKIFPVGRNFTNANPYSFNQKIASLNSVIKSHCSTVSNAKFIDTTSGFVDSNGYLINTYDGLHISSSYNQKFYNNIFNAVKLAESK